LSVRRKRLRNHSGRMGLDATPGVISDLIWGSCSCLSSPARLRRRMVSGRFAAPGWLVVGCSIPHCSPPSSSTIASTSSATARASSRSLCAIACIVGRRFSREIFKQRLFEDPSTTSAGSTQREASRGHRRTVALAWIGSSPPSALRYARRCACGSRRAAARAIVWQDYRTAARCEQLRKVGTRDDPRAHGARARPSFSARATPEPPVPRRCTATRSRPRVSWVTSRPLGPGVHGSGNGQEHLWQRLARAAQRRLQRAPTPGLLSTVARGSARPARTRSRR
jgi:hypothetical protein